MLVWEVAERGKDASSRRDDNEAGMRVRAHAVGEGATGELIHLGALCDGGLAPGLDQHSRWVQYLGGFFHVKAVRVCMGAEHDIRVGVAQHRRSVCIVQHVSAGFQSRVWCFIPGHPAALQQRGAVSGATHAVSVGMLEVRLHNT